MQINVFFFGQWVFIPRGCADSICYQSTKREMLKASSVRTWYSRQNQNPQICSKPQWRISRVLSWELEHRSGAYDIHKSIKKKILLTEYSTISYLGQINCFAFVPVNQSINTLLLQTQRLFSLLGDHGTPSEKFQSFKMSRSQKHQFSVWNGSRVSSLPYSYSHLPFLVK